MTFSLGKGQLGGVFVVHVEGRGGIVAWIAIKSIDFWIKEDSSWPHFFQGSFPPKWYTNKRFTVYFKSYNVGEIILHPWLTGYPPKFIKDGEWWSVLI